MYQTMSSLEYVAGYTYQLSHKELADSNREYRKNHRPKLKPSLQDREPTRHLGFVHKNFVFWHY